MTCQCFSVARSLANASGAPAARSQPVTAPIGPAVPSFRPSKASRFFRPSPTLSSPPSPYLPFALPPLVLSPSSSFPRPSPLLPDPPRLCLSASVFPSLGWLALILSSMLSAILHTIFPIFRIRPSSVRLSICHIIHKFIHITYIHLLCNIFIKCIWR